MAVKSTTFEKKTKKDFSQAGQAWSAALGRDALPPVVLMLASSEEIFRDALEVLLNKTIGDGNREFNVTRIDGSDTRPNTIEWVLAAKTAPMMAKRRVVLVTSADKWFAPPKPEKEDDDGETNGKVDKAEELITTKTKKDKKAKSETLTDRLKPLMDFAESSYKRGVILLRVHQVDTKSVLYKHLEKISGVYDFSSFGEKDTLKDNIEKEFKKHKINISREAAVYLGECLGGNAELIITEVKKLKEVAGDSQMITIEDIRQHVQRLRGHKLYELTAAFTERNARKGLVLLSRMEDSLVDVGKKVQANALPLMILTTLESEIRQLARVQGLLSENPKASDSQLAELLGKNVQDWQAKKLRIATEKFGEPELNHAIAAIHKADRRLKSTGTSPWLILQELFVDIATKQTRTRRNPASLGYFGKQDL